MILIINSIIIDIRYYLQRELPKKTISRQNAGYILYFLSYDFSKNYFDL